MTFSKNVLRIFVNPAYPELVEIYRKAVEAHKENSKRGFPDSGFDLYVPQDEVFGALMKTKMIDFQIKTEMKCEAVYSGGNGFFDRSKAFYLYPRSSLSKTPLMLSNHVGIVDSGYRGNLMGAFRCLYRDGAGSAAVALEEEGSEVYLVAKHTRLVQICMASLEPFTVELVEKEEDLSSTERGDGGFGSTKGVVDYGVKDYPLII